MIEKNWSKRNLNEFLDVHFNFAEFFERQLEINQYEFRKYSVENIQAIINRNSSDQNIDT